MIVIAHSCMHPMCPLSERKSAEILAAPESNASGITDQGCVT